MLIALDRRQSPSGPMIAEVMLTSLISGTLAAILRVP
ncbi:hypothetical protein F4553_003369 [Allocatelliglobosispora scoriae]|uniref:Uncharacterized protein n=1 Tax=Allocatelliglobosispora scoriae TaxID=643052 RepID=A0A841BT77_9ACTN|nr:hypothetical protein [Allocatelliglobosispora scoriae]